MVTKHTDPKYNLLLCFVLAKKLMVTKLNLGSLSRYKSFVLAKKLMVTKPQIHITINLRFYKM